MGRPAKEIVVVPSGIDGKTQLVPTVYQTVNPPDVFRGFPFADQDQPFKVLIMAPALTVFGMDPDGVPQSFFASKFLATGLKFFPQPLIEGGPFGVGVQPNILTVASDEEAVLETINVTVTTAAGGPARRVYLVSQLIGKEIGEVEGVATITQSGNTTVTYFGSKTFGFSPVPELTLPESGMKIRPGESLFIFIDGIAAGDEVRASQIGISTRKVS